MRTLIIIAILTASAVLGYKIASDRNRNPVFWAIVCFFLPLLGFVLLAQLKNRKSIAAAPIAQTSDHKDR